jgi:hypothetical protein
MSDTPFAGPHHLTTRETMLRPESNNARSSEGGMTVAYGTDDGMIVEFYEDTQYMEFLSQQTGHPIYRMQIMTRIVQPGNTKTVWVHPCTGIKYDMAIDPQSGEYHTTWEELDSCENGDVPEHLKYPKAWKRFMRKGVSADTGLPIEEWGIVSKSYAMSLKAMHVHTVEALASLTDQAAQTIMGAVKYRDLARAYLDDRQKMAIVSREQANASQANEQLAEALGKIEALQQHVLALQQRLNDGPTAMGGGRMIGVAPVVADELKTYNQQEKIRQTSVKDAKRKHKIPPKDTDVAA